MIKSEGDNLKRIKMNSQTKKTRRNRFYFMEESSTSVFQEEFVV
jgi:hypothetical protein